MGAYVLLGFLWRRRFCLGLGRLALEVVFLGIQVRDDAVFARVELGGGPLAEADLEFGALDGDGIEDGAPVLGDDDVLGGVVDDLDALVHEDLDLFLLGDDVHFPELGMSVQPAEDGGDAGHVRGLADVGQGLRRGGDALADASGDSSLHGLRSRVSFLSLGATEV